MLLMSLLLLLLLGLSQRCAVVLGAPAGREVYRMPQTALRALSDRGTVVLEAALTSALSNVERASSDRSRAESSCRDCVPCLFQDCGQRSTSCSSPARATSEPSCDVIGKAQKMADEGERSWALSQACGFYQRRCHGAAELQDRESCIRVMGESCSARVLQCSLLNTMQNLEPATQTRTQAVCGQRSTPAPGQNNATQPRSRIVGGSPATPGSWPWLVNLQLDGGLMCGGVLVDSSWVVTAAHCFAGSRSESYWTAVMGEFDITKTDPDEQVLKVNRIIPHPKFNPKTFNNDIALVELTSPAVLSERVTPVCLPSDIDPPTGSPCLVAGWGSLYEDGPSADVVMEAKVPLLPQSTCKSTLGKDLVTNTMLCAGYLSGGIDSCQSTCKSTLGKDLVTNTMLCAGYLSGGIDSCQGDSGGPLIYQDRTSGRFQLYGITSWGDGCGEKGKPGVYTRVTAFSDWIQAEIQKSFGSREPTCSELLKTTEMSEEEQRTEFSSLCRFYAVSCPPGQSVSTCNRMAEEKCLTRFKKCQLRSFLQTLLDLLQRAEDYIRDKVDLTFFTQTLPQLVEHIYSTAFAHTRDRRDLGGHTRDSRDLGGHIRDRRDLGGHTRDRRDLGGHIRDLGARLGHTHTAEQLGGADGSEDQRRPPPALFKEVGPLVEDWEKYLTDLADNLEQQPAAHSTDSPSTSSTALRQEEKLFIQAAEPSLQQLEGQYLSVISALRSKLDTKPAPPMMLHLDTLSFLQDLPNPSGTPADPTDPSSFPSEDYHTPDASFLSVLIGEIQKMNKQKGTSAEEANNGSLDGTPSLASEDPSSPPSGPVPSTSTGAVQTDSEGDRLVTTSSMPALGALFPRLQALKLHSRRRRSPFLRKRQIPGSNGKVCAVVTESSQRVSQVRDSYRWVLGIPTKNLHMTFQEVLVDLSSKNDRGLYEARVRAQVGGRPLTFYSLVGLENESFYRSMPRIIALALDGLKT